MTAKETVATEPIAPTVEERLSGAEQALRSLQEEQQRHRQAMEQLMAVIKEHLQETQNDPYRIATLEKVTEGLTRISEVLLAAVKMAVPGRR